MQSKLSIMVCLGLMACGGSQDNVAKQSSAPKPLVESTSKMKLQLQRTSSGKLKSAKLMEVKDNTANRAHFLETNNGTNNVEDILDRLKTQLQQAQSTRDGRDLYRRQR